MFFGVGYEQQALLSLLTKPPKQAGGLGHHAGKQDGDIHDFDVGAGHYIVDVFVRGSTKALL